MVNKNPPPDDRVVYLALKNVFKGQNAGIRNTKPIMKLLKETREQDNVANLIREHNIDVVCNSVQNLLPQEIFASTLKAKIRFPELFDQSPAQSAERESSEAEAAKHDAEAIQQAVQGQRGVEGSADQCVILAWRSRGKMRQISRSNISKYQEYTAKGKDPIHVTSKHQPGTIDHPKGSNAPQLFPVYLPFKVQHELLVYLQCALERACYDYGTRTMPTVLHDRQCSRFSQSGMGAIRFTGTRGFKISTAP